MSLASGSRLGSYEVLSSLGVGGMGEVYRARDSRLGRDVAIKVLPRELTTSADRLARFEREARVLAALNHPNVATIYGVEEHDGGVALVMELVEGEPLSRHIAAGKDGRLPLREALQIARQIALALDAAHEKGIVHRDLKPANVMVAPGGAVKVLDFGLAKAAAGAIEELQPQAATLAVGASQVGMLIGTAAYMSPEQVRGQVVDRRTDVWAFGCVLYEMLMGTNPFGGEDTAETLSLVLQREPDMDALPQETPAAVRRLLGLCLEKDRMRRLPQIAVAAYLIDDVLSGASTLSGAPAVALPRRRLSLASMLALSAAALIGASAAWLAVPRESSPPQVARFFIDVSPADQLGGPGAYQRPADTDALDELLDDGFAGRPSRPSFALSPDGRSIVFSAARREQRQLYVRRFDQTEATPIPGTDDAIAPFFSPDGRWVGYWANGELRRAPLSGGPPVRIAQTSIVFGASWGDDDRIVFARSNTGLLEVPAAGGVPSVLVDRDLSRGEVSYRLPHVLPGSDAVLYTLTHNRFPRWDQTQIHVYSRRSGASKLLIDGGADARYLPSGHLVYAREGVLLAAPFDVRRLELTAGSSGVLADVMQAAYHRGQGNDTGSAHLSIAANGTLAYVPGGVAPPADRVIVRVDRDGHEEPIPIPPRPAVTARLSPDGGQLAFSVAHRDRDIWLYSFARGTLSRLPAPGRNIVPIWSPDGQWITYASGELGLDRLYRMRADGVGTPQPLLARDARTLVPGVWMPDGQGLFYYELGAAEGPGMAIGLANLDDPADPVIIRPGTRSGSVDVSPDGRWIAYQSNESGAMQVYVQSLVGAAERHQVSGDGGYSPVWRGDGRELFYLEPASGALRMVAVPVTSTPQLELGAPQRLFEGRYQINAPARSHDVSADGQAFFLLTSAERPPPRPLREIVIVQNWFEELKRLVPVN